MSLLPDTSIWIDYFARREPVFPRLDSLLGREEVLTCGPILAELLAGTPPPLRDELRHAIGSLPFIELDYFAWQEAGERAHDLRSRGSTVPQMDILIAIAAVRAGAALWTRDRDFERVRQVISALELYELV